RWASFREDYRFTGKEEDVEVGLQYFGKRFLNPLLGRWISADPLAVHAPGEADLNLYAYVSGAVLKNVDPLGLEEEEQGEGAGGDVDDSEPDSTDSASDEGDGDTGAYGGGGASANAPAADAGTGHEGAPSEGKVATGAQGDGTERAIVETVGSIGIGAMCPVC